MTEEIAHYEAFPNKEIKGHTDNLSRKEITMAGLTIISTCYRETGKPIVRIGMSEYPQDAKQIVTGHKLTSPAEIDKQIDDLISQLESARKDAKNFLMDFSK
jgi:hypothetical protein